MAEPCELSSKDKILDAAETAFADSGFEGASLRNIVQGADVNLATVYYYFGCKEGLIAAVFKRLFDPVKTEQLARLTRLLAEAPGQPVTVEAILEAILTPAMCFTETKSLRNEIATRLIGRILTDPNPKTQEHLRCMHCDVRDVYRAALQQALPEVPIETLQWRLEFLWGALAFVLCNPSRFNQQTEGKCGSIEANILPQMISCFSAGLRAPGVNIR